MTLDIESIEELGPKVVADIGAWVTSRLREEHLYQFIRSRDEILRLERPDDSETIRILRSQYLKSLEKAWNGVLQALRRDLPTTLDQLLENFKPEFQGTSGLSARPNDDDPFDFPSASTNVPRAPVITSPNSRSRSPSILTDLETAIRRNAQFTAAAERADSEFGSADERPKKRTLRSEEPTIESPRKKAKRRPKIQTGPRGSRAPIKRSILLANVADDECIFSFEDYMGVYVLRCSQAGCKKTLSLDGPLTFKSHPFKDGLALKHFGGKGHHMDSEAQIFRKFATRVIDTSSERENTYIGDMFASSARSLIDDLRQS
ncbi:hypothetical protein F4777DRAFT_566263 [Nemania sp. FL0916]|nr:hypothetical protein F4777DRAFT_566263 [Nemania sp. FL0916]